ncbi:Calx-beta domain-containing protein [Roseobacter sp. N2S]|uniref:Calx-beta domain-containing protein n=1 Tax=Roseobacter sp. N2S TaxID=2663844 RepID=UPI00285E4970|nr:Calx-beta domain-containing protein [Roseobacter sp. N2S]MDR6266792.1 Ca2+-binding RTX toxin-like protein [Roseobacter sp. N2S]
MTTITINSVNADESIGSGFGGLITYTVSLSEIPIDTVSVNYRTLQATADESIDFPATSGLLVFAPGEDVKTITIRVNSDNIDETDEAFVLELFDPVDATFQGDAKVLRETAFVLDDDGVGLNRSVFVSSPVVVEGDGGTRKALFEVKLSQPGTSNITLDYQTLDGTATAGADYTAKTGSLTFTPGQTSKIVTINIPADKAVEPSEFFHLAVGANSAIADKSGGLVGTATILDDDAGGSSPTLSIDSVNAVESIGSGFGGVVRYTLTLSEPAVDVVTVHYRSVAESGVSQIDYPWLRDVVTFAPGETSKTISIRVNSDNVEETDEAFSIELYDPAGASFEGDAKVLRETTFILDDDGTGNDRAMSVSSAKIVEGDAATKQVVFEIKISQPSDTELEFNYSTRNGSAVSGQDYTAESGKITFAPGQTKTAVVVDVIGDALLEPSEFFHLVVDANSQLGEKAEGIVGTATILDDDAGSKLPTLSLSSVDTIESIGSGFGGTLSFELILSEPSVDTVTVNYRTLAQTALASIDYPEAIGTVTFAPGETSKFVDVRVNSDSDPETDESFTLELTDVAGAVFAGDAKVLRETAFILDDDGTGVDRAMSVSSPIIVEGDSDGKQAEFVIKLSQPSDTALEFSFTTRNGSAIAGTDYTAKSGKISFAPGQTEAVVRVNLKGDKAVEFSETFDLVLSATSALGDKSGGLVGTATLIDDDAGGPEPTLTLEAISATESIGSGFGGTVHYTFTLSKAAVDTVSVDYRTIAQDAVSSIDFPGTSGTLIFAPGETSKTVSIRVTSDSLNEADEALVLEAFDAKGAAFNGDAKVLRETAFILDDDGLGLDRALSVSSPVVVEGRGGTTDALFEIKLSRPSDTVQKFQFTTKDGSAIAGADYTAKSGTITFDPGQTTAYVRVKIDGDRAVELSEAFFLAVKPTASLGDDGVGAVGVAHILDDDAGGREPTISIEALGAQESIGSGFGGRPTLIVTLSKASTSVVTVDYRALAGTAENGVDFTAASGTITFAPGETSKSVSVAAISDSTIESDEAVVFEVSKATGASLSNDARWLRETAFISDDDGVNLDRTVFVSDAIAEEQDFGTSKAVFEIKLSEAFTETETFRFVTQNGTAKAGKDYVETKGAITFDAGQTIAYVSVDLISDFRTENDETFSLMLKKGSLPATLIVPTGSNTGEATILDNDIRGTKKDDVLRGTGDPEGIYGLNGNDKLVGRNGNDQLYGGAKNDVLNGGGGNDVLIGGNGNDKLIGGNGDDLLLGGKGADLLIGGRGADEFQFNFKDSLPGPKERDTIQDFNRGQGDVVNLSGIDGDRSENGKQDLTFIGRDVDFTAAGQVRFDTDKSFLEVNFNTDLKADIRIDMGDLTTFGVNDLLL